MQKFYRNKKSKKNGGLTVFEKLFGRHRHSGSGRLGPGGRAPSSFCRKIFFEPLEQRLLLSADLNPALQSGIIGTQDELYTPSVTDNSFDMSVNASPIIDMALADPALPPFGSLIHESVVPADFAGAGEIDTYTVDLDPNQTLTISLTPHDTSILGSVEILDPGGASVGSATAASAGSETLVQTIPVTTAGTYTINVRNVEGTGAYEVGYMLNALVKPAGAANNDIASALDINTSSIALPNGADRLAAVGRTAAADTPDVYSFDLVAGRVSDITVTPVAGSSAAFSLEILDSSGSVLALGQHGKGANTNEVVPGFVAPAGGTYYARVKGAADTEYTLVVTRGADFDLEPNSTPADARQLSSAGKALGGLGFAGGGSLSVAVLSSGSSGYDSGLRAIADQLNDDTYFDFSATLIAPSQADTLEELQPYDVVVIGGTGYNDNQFYSFAPALKPYVESGGGLVVTGWGIYASGGLSGQTRTDFDSIVPVNTSGGYDYYNYPTISPAGTHEIVQGVSSFSGFDYAEYPYVYPQADAGAETLATINGIPVAAAKDVVDGRSVYLGPIYAAQGYDTVSLRSGNADRLLEQAVAWAGHGGIDKADEYLVEVNAGDSLVITTATPGDGAAEPVNNLDPLLELYAPDGTLVATNDNGAADGRNAILNYAAVSAGAFRVRVAAVAGAGEYTLQVDGASGAVTQAMQVTGSSVGNDALLNTFPGTLTLTFSQPVLFSSLTPADLTVNGMPAAALTVIDATTVSFDIASLSTGDGAYTVQLAAGAVTDIHGTASDAFQVNFTFDGTPPVVVDAGISEGGVIAPGGHTVTMTFSENIAITGYAGLRENFSGTVVAPVSTVFNGNQLTIDTPSLPEGYYTLTLFSGPEGFHDLAGNPLNGGSPYTLNFSVDSDVSAFPVPLDAKLPAGSLIYDPPSEGAFHATGDSDSLTLDLDAGQTLTLGIEAIDPSVQAYIALYDPLGAQIGYTGAAAAGGIAMLQTVPVADGGVYRIEAGSLEGAGRYRVHAILNAAVEEEMTGGAANNARENAQDIDAGFIPIGGEATRGAVLGELPAAFDRIFYASESFEDGLTPAWSVSKDNSNAFIGMDEFANSGYNSLRMSGDYGAYGEGGGSAALNEAVWTVDLTGATDPTLSFWEASDDEAQSFGGPFSGSCNADGVSISADGTNWYPVYQSETDYDWSFKYHELDLSAAASDAGIALGPNLFIKFQQYSDPNLGGVGQRWWDDIAITRRVANVQEDWYQFTLEAGQANTIALTHQDRQGSNIRLDLYDDAGTLLASGVNSGNADRTIQDFVPGATGTFYAKVSGDAPGTYSLVVTRGADFEREPNGETSAQDISLSGQVLGGISAEINNSDNYLVRANAGDTLVVTTTTPGDGSGEPVNTLDTALELYDPAGVLVAGDDNSAADGHNAGITYNVPAGGAGIYRIRVQGMNSTVGDYVLRVQGATGGAAPFEVTGSGPVDGDLLSSYPGAYRVDFSSPLLLTSIDASDLSVNGISADSVTLVDQDTLEFSINPAAAGEGDYTVTLSAGSLVNLSGQLVEGFSASFRVDTTPPSVTFDSASAAGGVLAADGVAVTVGFSESLDAAGLGIEDVQLRNTQTGDGFAATGLSYDEVNNTATINFGGLPESNYILTLLSGPEAFRDQAGISLDGDNDGAPGGDWTVVFTTDASTRAFPTPLEGKTPAGSLIYDSAVSGLFYGTADSDDFTVDLDAGQTVTVSLVPVDTTFQGRVELFDSGGNSLGAIDAALAGAPAVLQTLQLASAGVYRIEVTSLDGSGRYSVQVLLNASQESGDNNALEGAQDISGSFISLGGSATRGAVQGGLSDTADADWYHFSIGTGEQATIALTHEDRQDASRNEIRLDLYDSTGTLLAKGLSGAENVDQHISGFVSDAGGEYYARVSGAAPGAYSLVVTRGANFDLELGDTASTAADLTLTGQALGSLGGRGTGDTGSGGGTTISLSTNLRDGLNYLWDIQRDGDISDGSNDAYDGGLYLRVAGSSFPGFSTGLAEDNGREIVLGPATIGGLTVSRKIYVPTDQNYARFLEIVTNPTSSTQNISLQVSSNLGSDSSTKIIATSSGDTAFAPDDNWIVTDDYDGGGDPTLLHVMAGADARMRPASASRSSDNLYYTYNLSLQPGETQIVMHFASQNQNQAAAMARAPQLMNLELNALGGMSGVERSEVVNFRLGDAFDIYKVQAMEGDALVISTTTPGVAGGEPVNALDTVIELYDTSGTLVASDDNSAADGRNASLAYTVPTGGAGEYHVVVKAANNTAGEYILSVTGASGGVQTTLPHVTADTLNAKLLPAQPDQLVLDFSEGLRADSVTADDLIIDGGATVTGVEMLLGNRLRFLLDTPAAEGVYSYSIADGAFTDLQGEASQAYSGSFQLDLTPPRVVSQAPDVQAFAPFSTWKFTFNEAINPSSVSTADVVNFIDPNGSDIRSSISGIAVSGNEVTVTFSAKYTLGNYTLVLGPDILDLAGHRMDQDGDGVEGESVEDRYTGVVQVASPDLSPVSVTVDPLTGRLGSPVSVSWTVRNIGTDSARQPNWYDAVYLSRDASYSSDDYLIGNQYVSVSPLASGGEYSFTSNFTMPLDTSYGDGTYYVVVRTDGYYYNYQPESNENNNTLASAGFSLTVPPLPDLTVSNVVAPTTVQEAGKPVTITWTDNNQGAAATNVLGAGGWSDTIYLSSDTTLSGTYYGLGTQWFSGSLESGTGAERSATVTLPSNMTGNWYVVVTADSYNTVYEHQNENNNTGASAALMQIIIPTEDLTPVSLTAPDSGVFSQPIDVDWTVRNAGTGPTLNDWTDRLWLSRDATRSSDDISITQLSSSGITPLAAGAEYTRSLDGITMPLNTSLSEGDYYLLFETDAYGNEPESNNNNNVISRLIHLTLPPLPDLVVSQVVVPADARETGKPITITWTDTNQGTAAAGEWNDRVYLSSDTTFDTGDYYIGDYWTGGGLEAGASTERSAAITLPANMTGDWYVLVRADYYNYVYEHLNENNNTGISAGTMHVVLPTEDLTPVSLTAPDSGVLGGRINVDWTVRNAGTGPTLNNWTDCVWLSRDATRGSDDIYVKQLSSSPLAAGAEYTRSVTGAVLPLNPSLSEGDYYLLLETDYAGQEPETNETNNLIVRPIHLTLPPLPDLVVSEIAAPATAWSGQAVPITWTLTNQGTGAAGGSWHDWVYLSTDAVWDNNNWPGNDQFFADFGFEGEIAAGGSVTRTQAITLPRDMSGDRWVIIRTDASGDIYEHTSENNNVLVDDQPMHVALSPFPNLQVTSVTPPTLAFSGQETVIEWVVTNNGTASTSSPHWYDQVYLSFDDTLDDSDILLGRVDNQSYLGVGESYAGSLTAKLPQGIDGEYFFIVKTDVFNNVYELDGEGDNATAGGPSRVQLTPPPDLQVTLVNAPLQAFSGQPMSLSWTVTNAGSGRTLESAWSDRLYMSEDEILDGGDRVLDTVYHSGALDSGESYEASRVVKLPVGVSGDYHFFVRTDLNNNVYEHAYDTNNDGFDATPTTILLTPPPDLEVSDINAPAMALASHPLTISYTVTNYGATATPNTTWTDSFYLSADNVIDESDLFLGNRTRYGALDVDQSYNGTFTATLPNGLSGEYHALVHTDRPDQVFELDNANNLSGTVSPITVESRPADLVVEGISAPAGGEAGRTIRVNWNVRNTGTGDTAVANWNDRIYISADDVLGNGDDVLLLEYGHSGLVNAGGTYGQSELITLPFTLASGDYHLFAVADSDSKVYELDYANNSSSALPITITRHTPDLRVTAVEAPAGATAGNAIALNYTVQNSGSNRTNSSFWYDEVFLSTDTMLSGDDRDLGDLRHSGVLEAGESSSAAVSVGLPSDITAGPYYLIVKTDKYNHVLEDTMENNNIGVSGVIEVAPAIQLVPDLRVVGVNAPEEAVSGRNFSLAWTVQNSGDATGSRTWYDAVYLSRDMVFDRNSDTYLGYRYNYGGLGAGAQYTATQDFTVPNGFSGPFYVFVVSDSGTYIDERSELNNAGFDDSFMMVSLAPPADLVAGDITIPANAVPGSDATITYSVRNEGINDAQGGWYDSVYISADEQWDVGDALFAKVSHRGSVLAGSSYSETVTAPLPGITPGDYHVIIRSDILNYIPESDEVNNLRATLDQVAVDCEVLRLNVAATGTLDQGQAVYYRIDVPANETLRLTLDSASETAANEAYIRFGRMPTRGEFDYSSTEPFVPDQQLIVPSTQAGVYYIMLYGDQVYPADSAPAYSLLAETIPFSIRSVDASTVGNTDDATLTIQGAKFDANTRFELVAPGGAALAADSVFLKDTSTVYATFGLFNASAGIYDVRAIQQDGATQRLYGAVTVVQGEGPDVLLTIKGPAGVPPNRLNIFTLNYANAGGSDMLAPLLLLESPNGTPIGMSADTLGAEPIHLLGASLDGPMDTLRPGARYVIPVVFRSTFSGGTGMRIQARPIQADDQTLITDWSAIEAAVRPSSISDSEWNTFWGRIQPRIGTTWGDYVKLLDRMVVSLSDPGNPIRDVRELFARQYAVNSNFQPASSFTGQLQDAETGASVADVDIAAYRVDANGKSTLGGFAVSDSEGRFTFSGLLAGNYVLAMNGRNFDADRDGYDDLTPTCYTVTDIADFDAGAVYVKSMPDVSAQVNESQPAMAVGPDGTPHIIWNNGDRVWHAYYNGTEWVDAEPISDAPGTNLNLVAAGNVIDGADPGLIAVWEQGADNASEIYYAVARPKADGGFQWSDPVRLTNDSVEDSGSAVVVTSPGRVLITHLKQNSDIQDDTDIYYHLVDVGSGDLVWSTNAPASEVLGSVSFGYKKRFGPWSALGLKIDAGVDFQANGGVNGCAASIAAQGSATAEFEGDSLGASITGMGSISANWSVDKAARDWKFEKAVGSWGMSGSFDWKNGLIKLLGAIPTPATKAAATGIEWAISAVNRWTPFEIENGINFGVGFQFNGLQWNTKEPFPDFVWPDEIAEASLSAQMGPYLKIKEEGVSDVELKVSGYIKAVVNVLPSVQLAELTGNVAVDAQVGWFTFNDTWTFGYIASSEDVTTLGFGTGSDGMNTLDDPGTLAFTYNPAGAVGTGAVYGGSSLLGDISGDLFDDSAPILAEDADGGIYAVWAKDADPNGGKMGSTIKVSDFDGAAWSSPVEVPDSLGLTSDVKAITDGNGHRIVLWTMADTSGISSATTLDEFQAIRDTNDVMFSVFDGSAWSGPRVVQSTPGKDGSLAVAKEADGDVALVWMYCDASGMYHLSTSTWNGTTWTTADEIASSNAMGDIAVNTVGGETTVFWTQDADADHAVTETGLFSSSLDQSTGEWSSAASFAPVLMTSLNTVNETDGSAALEQTSAASMLFGPPPEECLKCKEEEIKRLRESAPT